MLDGELGIPKGLQRHEVTGQRQIHTSIRNPVTGVQGAAIGHVQGGETEVTAPAKGVDVNSSFSGDYSDAAQSGFRVSAEERARANSSAATPEQSQFNRAYKAEQQSPRKPGESMKDFNARYAGKGPDRYKPINDQSIEAAGTSIPIGNTNTGADTASRVAFDKDASNFVAKEGTYDQMNAVANNKAGYQVPGSIAQGVVQGKKLIDSEPRLAPDAQDETKLAEPSLPR